MNEYDGVIMKPELTDEAFSDYGIIEHGWLKDAASKVHKYIDRWRGKNGKWYYKYKQEITDLKGRYRTRNGGRTNIDLDERENERGYSSSRSRGDQIYGSRNAKKGWSFTTPVKGLSDHGNSRSYSKQGVNRGTAAGRRRAAKQILSAKKGAQNKRTRGKTGSDLTSRGYSGSQGSGESKRIRNAASRRTVRYPWGSNIHRWVDRKGNVITNKVQYTVRGDGKEQNPDYWENRRKRAKKK